jgi:hypothetical protein
MANGNVTKSLKMRRDEVLALRPDHWRWKNTRKKFTGEKQNSPTL